VILRRRDDYDDVLRELGGELFAREGNVDKYFTRPKGWHEAIDEANPLGLSRATFPGQLKSHESWRPWHDVNPELVGDARIEAEERVLCSWLDREFSKLGRLPSSPPEPEEDQRTLRLIRITERIGEHIRTAPERERAALRQALIETFGEPL
jgi:hypothetical protein